MAIKLPDGDEFITSAEVCAIIGCHRTTLGRYVAAGESPSGSFMFGRNRYWRKSAVYDWLVFQETVATEGAPR